MCRPGNEPHSPLLTFLPEQQLPLDNVPLQNPLQAKRKGPFTFLPGTDLRLRKCLVTLRLRKGCGTQVWTDLCHVLPQKDF